jgi:hypothetical protein
MMIKSLLVLVGLMALIATSQAGIVGLATYGICQTGCNTAWVACVAAAGGTAGVATAGVAAPAAIAACSAAQGACMAACAALALSPI